MIPFFGSIFSPFFCPPVGVESASERTKPSVLIFDFWYTSYPIFHTIPTPPFPCHSYPPFPYHSYPHFPCHSYAHFWLQLGKPNFSSNVWRSPVLVPSERILTTVLILWIPHLLVMLCIASTFSRCANVARPQSKNCHTVITLWIR